MTVKHALLKEGKDKDKSGQTKVIVCAQTVQKKKKEKKEKKEKTRQEKKEKKHNDRI